MGAHGLLRVFFDEADIQKGDHMAENIACPNCEQAVLPDAQVCPHCGIQLHPQAQKSGNLPQPETAVQQKNTLPQSQTLPGRLASGELTQALPDVVKQFDSTATTNINIAGLLSGFYAGAIFAGKVLSGSPLFAILYALPLCFLLGTVFSALRVFYPDGYLNDDYLTLIRKKERRLRLSSLFLQIAIGVVIISVFVYLLRPA
jgi:hypothetical protein